MAIKTVFETSFELEKLLRTYDYIRSEPRFSISVLGASINVFLKTDNFQKQKLILELIPPYYSKYNFINFDPHELKKAFDKFTEDFKIICHESDRLGFKIIATVFHGGETFFTSDGLNTNIPKLNPIIYPAEKEKLDLNLKKDKCEEIVDIKLSRDFDIEVLNEVLKDF